MRVIISGPVTAEHLADAELLAGIVPTSFVTNGLSHPPAGQLSVNVIPICRLQPEDSRERARNYTLVQAADALVCVGENEHLVSLVRNYALLVYEVSE